MGSKVDCRMPKKVFPEKKCVLKTIGLQSVKKFYIRDNPTPGCRLSNEHLPYGKRWVLNCFRQEARRRKNFGPRKSITVLSIELTNQLMDPSDAFVEIMRENYEKQEKH